MAEIKNTLSFIYLNRTNNTMNNMGILNFLQIQLAFDINLTQAVDSQMQ